MRLALLVAAGSALLLLLACSSTGPVAGGSGTETTTGVTACIRNADGSPAVGANVTIRAADYLAPCDSTLGKAARMSAETVTGDSGTFTIDSLDDGDYRIEVNNGAGAAVLLHYMTVHGDTTDLGVAVLRPYAAIGGALGAGGHGALVQIYGMERAARADSAGKFSFVDLPEGSFGVRITAPNLPGEPSEVFNVKTFENDTALVRLTPSWRYARRIYLNTTSRGASLADPATGVPIPVRLESSDFDFTQAQPRGDDVRFEKSDGTALPFEAVRWDPSNGNALFWVRLDTVYPATDRYYFVMHWGNPSAPPASDPAAVFPTGDGFAGVWHLDTLDDATSNGNTAEGTHVLFTDGIAGRACSFNGIDAYLSIAGSRGLDMAGKNLTIVLWMKSSDHFRGERIFFEHAVWPDTGEYSFSAYNDSIVSFDFPDAKAQVRAWRESNNDGRWNHLAMTFNDQTDTARIYRCGEPIGADTVGSSIGSSSGPSYIGSRAGVERFYQGEIDELWILSRQCSPEWIRLLYETQRENQTTVVVR